MSLLQNLITQRGNRCKAHIDICTQAANWSAEPPKRTRFWTHAASVLAAAAHIASAERLVYAAPAPWLALPPSGPISAKSRP